MLTDQFGRTHNYLRISLTDQCNFACTYCRPELYKPGSQLGKMKEEEIIGIATAFVKYGISKIRLTGGEPMLRKDFGEILKKLALLGTELTFTTNGYFVEQYISDIKIAGVKSINVSLDSLDSSKFKTLTKVDYFHKVWNNILLLTQTGLHVKINVVLIRGVNDNEIIDFIEITKELPIHIRFIELMPFSGNNWKRENVVSYHEILNIVDSVYLTKKLTDAKHETAKNYMVEGFKGTFAIISTMTEPFCEDCNRIRLTADGKIKNCLFSKSETDLLSSYREGKDLLSIIKNELDAKHYQWGGQFNSVDNLKENEVKNRSMIAIGG